MHAATEYTRGAIREHDVTKKGSNLVLLVHFTALIVLLGSAVKLLADIVEVAAFLK